jgi:hypothetical protein
LIAVKIRTKPAESCGLGSALDGFRSSDEWLNTAPLLTESWQNDGAANVVNVT